MLIKNPQRSSLGVAIQLLMDSVTSKEFHLASLSVNNFRLSINFFFSLLSSHLMTLSSLVLDKISYTCTVTCDAFPKGSTASVNNFSSAFCRTSSGGNVSKLYFRCL